jgi:hypothetical protein
MSLPTGSRFAGPDAARRAVALALPLIEPAMREPGVCGSGFLVIVVMDPALGPADCRFEDAVLLEHCIGDRTRWDADYAAFARDKARLAWRCGRASGELAEERPQGLRSGDTLLRGAVCLDGIVVGVSGAEAWWDEAFATTVAAALKAIAKEQQVAARAAGRLAA